jgi:hypothetical protein
MVPSCSFTSKKKEVVKLGKAANVNANILDQKKDGVKIFSKNFEKSLTGSKLKFGKGGW